MRLASADPAALKALHIGGYWRGPNDLVRQMMLGLREAGAQVVEFNTDEHRDALLPESPRYDRGTSAPVWLDLRRMAPVIEAERPDLIVCNAGGLAFMPLDAARLRERHTLLGIALSDPEVFQPTTRHIAPTFDLFLTMAPDYVARYAATGARAGVLPMGSNPGYFHPVAPDPAWACDVLVATRALPDRIEPVRQLVQRFDVRLHGEGWAAHGLASEPAIYGDTLLTALASAAMSLVLLYTPSGHPLLKVGLFDFTAAGALVLTNRIEAFRPFFAFEEEIVTFGDTAELLDKVAHYLARPAERERIRLAGRARTLRDHSWPAAWQQVLQQLHALP